MANAIAAWPLWARKAIVDFVTTFLIALPGLTIALPDNGQWRDWLIATGLAIGAIAINALRRAFVGNLPDFLTWLKVLFGTQPAPRV